MPLLKVEADKLSNNDLVRGVIEEVIDRDDLFAVLPFTRTDGKAYVYNRENGVVEAEFLDPNEEVPEGAAKFTEVTTALRVLAHDVDIDKFLASSESDVNDQVALQIAAKAKGLRTKFQKTLINGDRSVHSKEFDGIAAISNGLGSSQVQVVGANGSALTLSMLDELVDMVPNGADCLVMRSGTVRAYRALLRAAGGTSPSELILPNFGRPMLCHNGMPIIVNDYIGTEAQGSADATTSVYALRLNEDDGLHGLHGGEAAGIRLEALGTVQNKDAWRYRLKWYVGLALKSTRSMARLKGITNV
ncbi:major capsid protein [Dyella telluris]|uniref:Phage major capsid protein n=1 Tax=Dyella telluris TaxID=2763498 RepID=A0A7G8Q4G4_9GAMM|nr:phage major capsid protein [Dyella telluris]QNK01672.1 phage major capsid protein [Dyella telluris]